jgi:hypothetical protein
MVITKGFFSKAYQCEWCRSEFDSKSKAWNHELDCKRSPGNQQKTRTGKMQKKIEKANILSIKGGLENLIEAYNILNKYYEGYDTYKKMVGPVAKKLAEEYEKKNENEKALDLYLKFKFSKESNRISKIIKKNIKQGTIKAAKNHERLLEFDEAAKIYKKLGMDDEVIRIREAARNKVEQTVVHGDQVTKTEIKDSVLNRSNIGSGGSSKMQELKDLTEMKKEGLIDDDEFKQMKKEILGK